MRVGICGFPTSGKTTVFTALSPGASSSKGGISFGNIKVPDGRVDRLSAIFSPKKTTYAEVTFMDVSGQGGRVGGAFPSEVVQAMRNADVLVHVVRGFNSPFASEPANPARDVAAFNDELVLLDLGVLEKVQQRWHKERRKGADMDAVDACVPWLEEGQPLRDLELGEQEVHGLKAIQLLSNKPLLTLYNLDEDSWEDSPWRHPADGMAICGTLEAEIADMEPAEQAEFLEGLGLGEPARNTFIRQAYERLDLISFLTAGPDECRAWPVRKGANARKAAGTIHSDLERGFIRAEVYQVEDLEEFGTEPALKAAGRMRVEGKDYVVQDGDVMHVRFNV